MRCESVRRVLAAYVLGDVAPPDRAGIIAHMADCHRCREEEAALRDAVTGVRDLPEIAPSAERRSAALVSMRRGAAERLARPRWVRTLRSLAGRRRRLTVATLFAASVLGLVAVRVLDLPIAPVRRTVLLAEAIRGPVTIERTPLDPPVPLVPGVRLPPGCVVRVGDDGRAAFRPGTGGLIECREGSAFRWEPSPGASGDTVITLYYGALWCDLEPLPRGRYVIRDVRDRRLTVVGTRFEVVCK